MSTPPRNDHHEAEPRKPVSANDLMRTNVRELMRMRRVFPG